MRTLTKLNLDNLRQNRARTIVTIIGIALSVALILSVIGVVTSLIHTLRMDAINQFGDYHILFADIPGDKISVIEKSQHHIVQYYSEPVDVEDLYGYSLLPTRDSYTAIVDPNTLVRDSKHLYNVYLKYRNPTYAIDTKNFSHNPDIQLERALRATGYDDEVHTSTNSTIFELDGGIPEIGRILLLSLATFCLGVMAIVAAFLVRNSFSISITERVRQFGMLASVGARPRQIRHMVYQEAGIVGLIAVPLGIALGVGATAAIVATINNLVVSLFDSSILFYIPLEAFILIIVIGMIIITLSAASPAMIASRVSPIAALRNVQDVKLRAKKVRTPKFTQKIWGIGGVIAQKNLKRSRRKYRTTVVSIVVSVAIFIGIASFMGYGRAVIGLFFEDTGANYSISYGSIELYQKVAKRFGLKEYGYYQIAHGAAKDSDGNPMPRAWVRVVSRDEFTRFAKRSGYRGDDFAHQIILHDYYLGYDSSGSPKYKRGTNYKVGETLSVELERMKTEEVAMDEYAEPNQPSVVKQQIALTITQISETTPLGESERSMYSSCVFYLSEDNPLFSENREFFRADAMYIKDSGFGERITNYLENDEDIKNLSDSYGIYYYDIEKDMQITRNTILLSEILVYGFIIVVSLIGVTNIFNTITTNIALRAKEFAILKSIGMTQKEFNHMIRLESILYTTRALFIGLPIGMLISYGVFKLFDGAMLGFGWLIPWWAVATSIIAVALLVASIMRYSTRRIRKQNIIETIRKESF